jgi:hypothetical protein
MPRAVLAAALVLAAGVAAPTASADSFVMDRSDAVQTFDSGLTVRYSVSEPARLVVAPTQRSSGGTPAAVRVAAAGSDQASLTVTFSRTVVDPVLHLSGLGEAAGPGTADSRPIHATLTARDGHRLTNSAGALAVLDGRTVSPAEAEAVDADGSVVVKGAIQSISLDLAVVGAGAKPEALSADAVDSFAVSASVGEGAGSAPQSYDGDDPARAVVSELGLGSSRSEDGVQAFDDLRSGSPATVTKTVAIAGSTEQVRVCGWLDFDLSGSFDPAERSCTTAAAGAGTATLSFIGVPEGAGTSYARFRIGYNAVQVESPTGPSDAGEVEDYTIAVVAPKASLRLEESITPDRVSRAGQVVRYTFTATNDGDVPLSNVAIANELEGLSALTCNSTAGILLPRGVLSCVGTRPTTQQDLDFGGIFDAATVFGEAPGGDPNDPTDDIGAVSDGEVRITQQGALSLSMTSDASPVHRGDTVNFRLLAKNTGNVTLSHVHFANPMKGLSKWSCSAATVAPGAAISCESSYTVTAGDARAGTIRSRSSARAEAPYGDVADPADDVTAADSVTVAVRARAEPPSPSESPTSPGSANPSAPSTRPGTGTLPDTGGPALGLLVAAVALLTGGAALTLIGRRRGQHS